MYAVCDLDNLFSFEVRCPTSCRSVFYPCASRVKRAKMMNEPQPGYNNLLSLHKFEQNTELHLGNVCADIAPVFRRSLAHYGMNVTCT